MIASAGIVAVVVALAACGGSGSSASPTTATTASTTSSTAPAVTTTTVPPTTTSPSQAFAAGLTAFFASDGDHPAGALPTGYADCVSAKVTTADRDAIAAVKTAADVGNVTDDIGVRVTQAGGACDAKVTATALGSSQPVLNLDSTRIECIGQKVLAGITALDPSAVTGTSSTAIRAAIEAALAACAPLTDVVGGVVEKLGFAPADKLACVGQRAGGPLTVSEVLQLTPAAKLAIEAGLAACVPLADGVATLISTGLVQRGAYDLTAAQVACAAKGAATKLTWAALVESDPTTVQGALASGFAPCVTVVEALSGILHKSHPTAASATVSCIATTAGASLTWTDLMQGSQKMSDAVNAAVTGCR